MHNKLDILAFGVHPDDVELGCAGTLLAAIAQGKQVGIVDLTKGELGTRGTIETRKTEAANAAKVLGVNVRENLDMRDGFVQNDEINQRKIIEVIRKYRPDVVLANAPEDRHPDHGRGAKLVADAAFLAGLRKIETMADGNAQEPWRPQNVYHYIQDRDLEPSFLVDISGYHDKKLEVIFCYATQFFNPGHNEPPSYISSAAFMEAIKARASLFGHRIGVEFAEGFITEKTLGVKNFDAFIQHKSTIA